MMMSASAMSAMIRAKKKKMEEDPDVVKLSGIPMDATDIDIAKREEATDALNENIPKQMSDGTDQSPAAEMSEEEKAQKEAKREKIMMMMNRMQKAI